MAEFNFSLKLFSSYMDDISYNQGVDPERRAILGWGHE